MNRLDALDLATDEFSRRLSLVDPDQWDNPTPCTDWDVHYLVAHVVGGNSFASLVLNGATVEKAIETIMGTPQLGGDPHQDFAASATKQSREFRASGRLAAMVDHPLGAMSGSRFLSFRIMDIALHTWDLAIGINADAALNDNLVDVLHQIIESEGGDMGFGINALGEAGPNATAQDRLLDLMGRRDPSSKLKLNLTDQEGCSKG